MGPILYLNQYGFLLVSSLSGIDHFLYHWILQSNKFHDIIKCFTLVERRLSYLSLSLSQDSFEGKNIFFSSIKILDVRLGKTLFVLGSNAIRPNLHPRRYILPTYFILFFFLLSKPNVSSMVIDTKLIRRIAYVGPGCVKKKFDCFDR